MCQHIVHGLRERERVGFFWAVEDPANPRPDAWCAACNMRVQETDGEWVGASAEYLGISILCGACYDLAKTFHMGGDPWS